MPDISVHHRQGRFSLGAEFSLQNQWTVVFGPSGAGKSTLLRIIAGLVEPASGRIRLNDRTLLDTNSGVSVPAGRRSIGFVTQQPALFPHLNVRDNVGFGIRHFSPERRAERIAEMLQLLGAEALADRPTLQLSGGERQRVAMARALA
ncbi:MAG: ATP-binding cassette domain-containing protein, partial [Acidobacteriaceae bacterium]